MGLPEDLIITSPIQEDFICGICQEVFVNPVLAEGCEHVFCKSCIENWTCHAEGKKATCPIDRKEITRLKTLQRPFKNLYNNLQVRCKFHSFGCEAVIKLGDMENHWKSCIINPGYKKPCVNGCGAFLLKKEDIEGHNCVDFLKSTIEELKLNQEKASQYQKEQFNHQHKRMQFITSKLFATEHGLLRNKIKNLLMDHSKITQPELIKEQVKELRIEVTQAKDILKQLQVMPDESEWLKGTVTDYDILEQALEPMSPEMQQDVQYKFGGWFTNYRPGTESKLAEINQELSLKYGGMFISTVMKDYSTSRFTLKTEIDELVCRIVLSQAIQAEPKVKKQNEDDDDEDSDSEEEDEDEDDDAERYVRVKVAYRLGVNVFRI